MTDVPKTPHIAEEQLLYAKILEVGMYIGLLLLLVTFTIYTTGLLAPGIPVEELPNYWKMPAHEYLKTTNAEYLHQPHPITGWSWIWVLGKGDYLNYVGIVTLSAVTIVCFLGIIPTLLRKKDFTYSVMSLLEALILALAASGILRTGGH